MTWFVLICGVIAAVVLLSLLRALQTASKKDTNLQTEIAQAARRENIDITRERLAALPKNAGHDEDRLELEAALADDLGQLESLEQTTGQRSSGTRSALVFLVATPIAAVALYMSLGDTSWIRNAELPTPAEIRANPQQSMTALIDRLEQTLVEDPDNPAGWTLAGRTYMSMGRYADAEAAYAKANTLQPDDSELLAAWSDAALLENGNQYTPEIKQRTERAIELDPNNPNALWIAGMGNISTGETEQGLGFLERLQPMLAEQPQLLQQITAIIDQVRGGAAAPPVAAGTEPDTDAVSIAVDLDITPTLLADLPLDTTVFVFARAVDGPPMPLAAQRLTVAELPATILLDDASAMMPGRTITSVNQVAVVARISLSGDPIEQPGDISSDPVVVDTDQNRSVGILLGN